VKLRQRRCRRSAAVGHGSALNTSKKLRLRAPSAAQLAKNSQEDQTPASERDTLNPQVPLLFTLEGQVIFQQLKAVVFNIHRFDTLL